MRLERENGILAPRKQSRVWKESAGPALNLPAEWPLGTRRIPAYAAAPGRFDRLRQWGECELKSFPRESAFKPRCFKSVTSYISYATAPRQKSRYPSVSHFAGGCTAVAAETCTNRVFDASISGSSLRQTHSCHCTKVTSELRCVWMIPSQSVEPAARSLPTAHIIFLARKEPVIDSTSSHTAVNAGTLPQML